MTTVQTARSPPLESTTVSPAIEYILLNWIRDVTDEWLPTVMFGGWTVDCKDLLESIEVPGPVLIKMVTGNYITKKMNHGARWIVVNVSIREWMLARPGTIILSSFFTGWFVIQLAVLYLYGEQTARWLFYTELPPTVDPGLLFSPISHDMFNYTHLTSNIAFVLLVGGLLEPYVHWWKVPALVIVGGYLGMAVTMSTAIVHQFWPLAGASTGIMILWGYTGLKMWYVLDLRETFSEDDFERKFAGFVLLAVPAIPVYEVFVNGNMGHAIGIILGVLFFGFERWSG